MSAFAAPISKSIWDMKYRFKTPEGEAIDETVQDSWRRVARALVVNEKDPAKWEDVFYNALESFKFLPAGRILAGAGTDRCVTLFNCFVMGTMPDTMSGIFDSLKEAALTMQQGGGSVMISRRCAPKVRALLGLARMLPDRCPLWMFGIRCVVQLCRQVRDAAR